MHVMIIKASILNLLVHNVQCCLSTISLCSMHEDLVVPLCSLKVYMYTCISSYKSDDTTNAYVSIHLYISKFVLVCVCILGCEPMHPIRVHIHVYIPRTSSLYSMPLNKRE